MNLLLHWVVLTKSTPYRSYHPYIHLCCLYQCVYILHTKTTERGVCAGGYYIIHYDAPKCMAIICVSI